MDVSTTFIANNEAAELIEPGKASLNDPAMPTESGFALDIAARDARDKSVGKNLKKDGKNLKFYPSLDQCYL